MPPVAVAVVAAAVGTAVVLALAAMVAHLVAEEEDTVVVDSPVTVEDRWQVDMVAR